VCKLLLVIRCKTKYGQSRPYSTSSIGRRDLEIWVRGHSRSLKMAPFDRSHTSSYSSSIVSMAVSCNFCEIKRDTGRKTQIIHTPLYLTIMILWKPSEFLPKILIQTARVPELIDGAKILPNSSTIWAGCTNVTGDRQTTDGQQTDGPCRKRDNTWIRFQNKPTMHLASLCSLTS